MWILFFLFTGFLNGVGADHSIVDGLVYVFTIVNGTTTKSISVTTNATVYSGNWNNDIKNGNIGFAGAEYCKNQGELTSNRFDANCQLKTATQYTYNTSNCTGPIVSESPLTEKNYIDNKTVNIFIECAENHVITNDFVYSFLLTGKGSDIQLLAALNQSITQPLIFSSYIRTQTSSLYLLKMTYTKDNCYQAVINKKVSISIDGYMDCESGEMSFTFYNSSNCTGSSYKIENLKPISFLGEIGGIFYVSAFCLDQPIAESLSPLLYVIISVISVSGVGLMVFAGYRLFQKFKGGGYMMQG